ncbi:MAG: Fic family protein [Aureispira sp.]
MKDLLATIEQLKATIDEFRPLDKDTLGRIEQKFRLDWNYHSNAIEGNSLNFGETKSFLLHGITAAGKTLKDHLDLRGHNEAIVALEDIIKEERPITENFIRELHKIILVEDSYNPAETSDGRPTRKKVQVGQYKSSNNYTTTATGETLYFASVEETPAKMYDLIQWLRSKKEEENPVVLAALFHYKFIKIHPFDDGNGRLARILMNFILMRAGFPPVVIKTKEKEAYFRALQQADGGDVNAFVKYVGEQLVDSLELYLKGAKGESVEELDDVDKEFELFKMKLSELNSVDYLNEKNYVEYFDKSIVPTLEIILDKIRKISLLFNRTDLWLTTPAMEWEYEMVMGEEPRPLKLKDFKDEVKSLYKSIFEEETLFVRLNYEFFAKKTKKEISYDVVIVVKLKDNRFIVEWKNSLINMEDCLYEHDNSKKAKVFANYILKDFLMQMKQEMKEEEEPFPNSGIDDLPF